VSRIHCFQTASVAEDRIGRGVLELQPNAGRRFHPERVPITVDCQARRIAVDEKSVDAGLAADRLAVACAFADADEALGTADLARECAC
jgi:hypothetical protein